MARPQPRDYMDYSRIDIAELRRSMRTWIAGSAEMDSLQRALRWLYPDVPQNKLRTERLAEVLMFMALRGYEGEMRASLGRLSAPLARLIRDAETLSAGASVAGRSAADREKDLKVLVRALEQIVTLEERIRHAAEVDPALPAHLRDELEKSLHERGAGRAKLAPVAPLPASATAGTAQALTSSVDQLRLVLARSGLTPESNWNAGDLSPALRQAANNVFVAAGEDIAEAVRRVHGAGGLLADGMVIALLWAEGHIEPGRPTNFETYDMHQRMISGLWFEWMGQETPHSWNKKLDPRSVKGTLGIDAIKDLFLVDAKHNQFPVEDLLSRRDALVNQMQRQLKWAGKRGLRGISWIANTEEAAEALRRMADEVFPKEVLNGLEIRVSVGGLP